MESLVSLVLCNNSLDILRVIVVYNYRLCQSTYVWSWFFLTFPFSTKETFPFVGIFTRFGALMFIFAWGNKTDFVTI